MNYFRKPYRSLKEYRLADYKDPPADYAKIAYTGFLGVMITVLIVAALFIMVF